MELEKRLEDLRDQLNVAKLTSAELGVGIKVEERFKIKHGIDLPLEEISFKIDIGYKDGKMTFVNLGLFDVEDFDEYYLSKNLTKEQFISLDNLIKKISSKLLTKEEQEEVEYLGGVSDVGQYQKLTVIETNLNTSETIH